MRKHPVSSARGVVRGRRFRETLETIHFHPRRSLAALVLLLIFVGCVGVVVWNHFRPAELPSHQLVDDNGYEKAIKELQSQQLSSDPVEQVYYYSRLAHNYEALDQYKDALKYYLQGQSIVDLRNLENRMSLYTPIADMYEKIGQQAQAKQYRDKAAAAVEKHKQQLESVPEKLEATLE